MKLSLYVFLILSFFTQIALAQDEEANMVTEKRSEDPMPVSQYAGPSEAARQGKMGGVEFGMGLIVGAVSGTQLVPYYNINPNLSVGLMLAGGTFDLTKEISDQPGTKLNKASIDASLLMIHGRWFAGNSFYVNGGIGQRSISAGFDVESTTISYGIKGDVEATSTSLMVGIGNQWQWESGFTLGVEWIGYVFPLSSSTSDDLDFYGSDKDSATGSSKDSVDKLKKDTQELAELFGEAATPRLLNLSIGWSF